jgi:hypothetical protein
MRNITRITTQDELSREIADTQMEIERQKLSVRNNWTSLKNDMRPVNVVRGLFSRPAIPLHNGTQQSTKTTLPVMAAKMAAGLLLNRWMAKKSFGVTKMAAGMVLQTGLVSVVSNWLAKKLQKKPLAEAGKKVA